MPTPVLKVGPNGVYYAFWSEGRRSQRKSMGTRGRLEAETRFASWLLEGGHLTGSEESGEAPLAFTVEECWQVYHKHHVVKRMAGAATAQFNWKNLGPHFGRLRPAQITQQIVDDYVGKRTSGLLGRTSKPQTCRKELTTLYAALNFVSKAPYNMLPPAHVVKVRLPDAGQPRDRWLRMEEMQRLLNAAARLRRGNRLSRGERFLWIALETAARLQAILDLTWDRVDFETNTIHFDVPGRRLTKKKRAAVAMSSSLRPILQRAFAERLTKGDPRENLSASLVMDNKGDVWATVQLIAIEGGFGGERPKVLRSEKPKATGISPHTLRHTAATHMARRGVPLWKIAKILGNTLAMVERVYAKWAPEDPENTVDLISGGLLEPAE